MWDVVTGEERWSSQSHRSWVSAVACDGNGRTVASGGLHDYTLRLVAVESVESYQIIYSESQHDVVTALAFSPDSRTLVSGEDHGLVKVWDTATCRLWGWVACGFEVLKIQFSPDGRWIRVADSGGPANVPGVYVFELCHLDAL